MTKPANAKGPIFILGILGRSGTNYVSHLLDLHPDCTLLTALPEDWLLAESRNLDSFVQAVLKDWNGHPEWNMEPDINLALYRGVGQGLLAFLEDNQKDKNKRLVTKTPSITGLSNFFKLFPNAYLLINVRDGRDVAESAWKSVGTNPDRIARWWAESAELIAEFDRANRDSGLNYCIVRYEDLIADLENELTRVLKCLDLDVLTYPFQSTRVLPIYGSSSIKSGQEGWEWRIADKPVGFNPIKRWEGWSRKQHERFNWIAGKALPIFNYQAVEFSDRRLYWTIYNLARDFVEFWGMLKTPKGRKRVRNHLRKAWKKIWRGKN